MGKDRRPNQDRSHDRKNDPNSDFGDVKSEGTSSASSADQEASLTRSQRSNQYLNDNIEFNEGHLLGVYTSSSKRNHDNLDCPIEGELEIKNEIND
jgi:hypothetical protein